MAELLKDKMIAKTVKLVIKYLEVNSQTFKVSEHKRKGAKFPIPQTSDFLKMTS